MARLVIKLLGCFQVSIDGRPQTGILSDKGRALLTYLALEADRPHRREALAELLWPNRPHPEGRANLRQSLHRLRQSIDDTGTCAPALLITPQEVQFNCSNDCWLDVSEFRQSLNTAINHHQTDLILCEVCLRQLQNAAELYQGDLLAGFSLPDCLDYDWWLLSKVEEFHRQAVYILEWLVIHSKQKGNYSIASQFAQRAIELEPWRERSHRMKMRALALAGNPGAAIHQYEICCQILAKEMGIGPSEKTRNLFEQIRQGRVLSLSNLEGGYWLRQPINARG